MLSVYLISFHPDMFIGFTEEAAQQQQLQSSSLSVLDLQQDSELRAHSPEHGSKWNLLLVVK